MNEQIMKELKELPEQIKIIEKKLFAHVCKKTQLRNLMDLWENKELSVITNQINPDGGKKMFSNDISRRAELNRRKGISNEYQTIHKEFMDRDALDNSDKIEFNFLDRTFKAVRKMADLLTYKR